MRIPSIEPHYQEEQIRSVEKRVNALLKLGDLKSGSNVAQVESLLAKITGIKHVVSANSGSGAMQLILEVLKERMPDMPGNVIIPTNCSPETVIAAERAGFSVKLCDINPDTLGLDYEQALGMIDPHTRVVIPVHVAGIVDLNLSKYVPVFREQRVFVLEDASMSLGSSPAIQGDASIVSFTASSVFSGCDGGAIITSNAVIAERCRVKQNDNTHVRGWNYRMSELDACMISEELLRYDEILNERRSIAKKYIDAFPDRIIGHTDNIDQSCWFKVLYMTKISADRVKDLLFKKGVELQDGAFDVAIHKHRWFPVSQEFPAADHYLPLSVSLPIFRGMTSKQVDQVIKVIQKERI